MKKLQIATIQMDCVTMNVSQNIERASQMIEDAAKQGANMVVLPELFNVGYELSLIKEQDYEEEVTIQHLAILSKKLSIQIIAGVLEKDGEKYYNTAIVFNDEGELIGKYRKINLFPLSGEMEIFTPGQELKLFKVNDILIGVLICYDIRFPELSREYYKHNCQVLIVLSAFPHPRLDHWNTLLKARAIENQCYVVASNRVGKDGDLEFLGNSCVIDSWGNLLGQMNSLENNLLVQEIDCTNVTKVRNLIPCLKSKVWCDKVLDREAR